MLSFPSDENIHFDPCYRRVQMFPWDEDEKQFTGNHWEDRSYTQALGTSATSAIPFCLEQGLEECRTKSIYSYRFSPEPSLLDCGNPGHPSGCPGRSGTLAGCQNPPGQSPQRRCL
uniref:Uncharacterized protein n=1 Tax=Taeniopygia guttata TaxID=59729 RepID=A0A674H3C2_TAEGU